MKILKPVLVALVVLSLLFYFITPHFQGPENSHDEALIKGPYTVERVVDGDTVICKVDGIRERIRLIGIDAPESVSDNPDRITEEGITASIYVHNLLDKKKVFLEYDVEKRDQYDRLLAYVYIKDNEEYVMINILLVEKGYAVPYRVLPNVKYENEIKRAGEGM